VVRRPSPLPPPASTAPRHEDPQPEDGQESDAAVLPLAGAGTDATARARRDKTGPRGASDPFDAGSPPTAEAAGQPVGVLAVWRAARARRRALRAEVRRFTVRQRRRRALWISIIGAVLVVAGVTAAIAYSPLFAVERIRVIGAVQLDAATVEQALAPQLGTPLPLVDEAAIQATLSDFPFVQSYTLEARPPHDLVVRVVERTPIGAIDSGSGYSVVDAAGVVLAASTEPPAGEPLLDVRGGLEGEAFAAVGQVMRALPPSVGEQVTGVAATSAFDVTLTLSSSARVVWGSAERSAYKAVVLERIFAVRPPDTVTEYDVSSPDAAVIR
jgi:cell division protein FtsQ